MYIEDAVRFGRKERLGLLRMRKFPGYFLHDAGRFVQKLLHVCAGSEVVFFGWQNFKIPVS
jgi:hypothetical protein